ncbi:hypothetical protein GCM10023083_82540 [Streptomyces phyllanthi]
MAADAVAGRASSHVAAGAVRAVRIEFCRARLATRARSYQVAARGGLPSVPAIHQRAGQGLVGDVVVQAARERAAAQGLAKVPAGLG